MGHTPGMPSTAATASYTWDDFVTLDEDDRRELIDGELVEVEVPTEVHEHIVGRITSALIVWSDQGHGGRALTSGYKVRVSERRGVMPDVQFYREGNTSARGQQLGLVTGCPDLVVEVVSPTSGRHDRVTKLRYYAQLGVPEYWLVDPQSRTLERLVLRDGGGSAAAGERVFSIAASLAEEEVFRPESFEGLEIPLGRLWG
jgi:Uma2 family endonuclease